MKGVKLFAQPLLKYLAGDLGLEPRASGSGDQRSIQLS